jgi:NAD dependent epimerase/dehydratase family enzyme
MQSWIHLTDVANLYYFVIQNQVEGIINAVAPISVSNQDLTKALASHLKRPLFLPNIPQFVMKLILGEMSILLFNNKKIVPQKALSLGFKFQFPSAEEALQNIIK